MKKKIQFAVILTEEKKTVLVIENNGVYKTLNEWQKRAEATGSLLLYASETDSINIDLSHYFM